METVEDDYFHDDPVDELLPSNSLLKFPLKIKLVALAELSSVRELLKQLHAIAL